MMTKHFQSRPSIVTLFLAQLLLSATPHAVAGSTLSSDASNKIAVRISEQWSCSSDDEILDMQLQFNMANDGTPYDIELLSGYENPRAIRSLIHAVLFSGPYNVRGSDTKVGTLKCTVRGACAKPSITIEDIEKNETAAELQKAPLRTQKPDDKPNSSLFAYPIDSKLTDACAQFYSEPDSVAIKNELDSLCNAIHLSPDDPQTWLAVGRSRSKVITIKRNPSPRSLKLARASAAAFMQAARLRRTKPTLYEYEEACVRVAAVKVLQVSKADPVLLASAALLTYQLNVAKAEYAEAIKYGDNKAKILLDQMVSTKSVTQSNSINEKQLPVRTAMGWEQTLNWLPLDTELIVVNYPLSTHPTSKKISSLAYGVLSPEQMEHLKHQIRSKNGFAETDKIFANSKTAFALHAARRFEYPKSYGLGSSDSADILVFEDASKPLSKLVMESIRPYQSYRQMIEGSDVLAFDAMPFTFGRFGGGQNPQTAQFVCSPIEGVLISTNKIDYMREILAKLSEAPSERAMPANLPEWKQIDLNSQSWGLRHYNKAAFPFDSAGLYNMAIADSSQTGEQKTASDANSSITSAATTKPGNLEIGFCYYITKDSRLVMKSLSMNDATLKNQERQWLQIFDYDWRKPQQQIDPKDRRGKSKIVDHVLTVEGRLEEQPGMVMLLLISSLGYFVSI